MTPLILPGLFAGRFFVHAEPNLHTGSCCWECTARSNRNGYTRVWDGTREPVSHRVSWEYVNGPIPTETPILDHLCRVRKCIRPDHLEPVTYAENTRRGLAVLFTRCELLAD